MNANYTDLSRRQLVMGAAALAAAGLSGCGFHLRNVVKLPFDRIWLSVDTNSSIGADLKQSLKSASGVRVVQDRDEAQALLHIIRQHRSSGVAVINPQGRAREYELKLTIEFKLTAPDGFELIPATAMSTSRDLTVRESDHLARESTSARLYEDMQRDLVRRIVLRISRTKLNDRPVQ